MRDTIFNEEESKNKKKLDFKLWGKIFQFAWNYKSIVIGLTIVMIISALIESTFPAMSKYAIDRFIVPKKTDGIIGFGIFYFSLILVQTIVVWLLIVFAGKLETYISYDIRKAEFTKLQEFSFSYFDKTPIGWIMSRLTSDCLRLGEIMAWGIVDIVWGFSMMLIIPIIMLVIDWKLTLIVMSVTPILAYISIKFQSSIIVIFRQVRKINSLITGAFNEGITGAKTTKTLVREKENFEEFGILSKGMYSYSVKAAIQSSFYLPIVLIIGSLGTSLALWSGGNGVIAGNISYGTLVSFIWFLKWFFNPVMELARKLAEFVNAQSSGEKIFTLLETKVEITDSKDIMEKFPEYFSNELSFEERSLKGKVEFKAVNFNYNNGEKVLNDFNLKIEKGETIALVGETGAGKSTIVNLLCRFYEPTTGEILIDDTNYMKIPQKLLQSNIAMVLQTPHLFSGSVKENIRYGKLSATDSEIIQATKLVNAHNFIEKLENKYDTEVGEGGSLLSTGQKQLITFARAILANPSILILDEATSSVDTETEVIIQKAINLLLKGRTSIIIAHRLSTIRSADRILVLENGKILESGNHHELMKQKGHYFDLYTNQFIEEKEIKILNA